MAVAMQKAGEADYECTLSIPQTDRVHSLIKQLGMKEVHALLFVLLKKFQDYFTITDKMNEEQMVEAAYDLLTYGNQYYVALEDYILFFEQSKKGKYGKIYKRLDGSVLHELFDRYLNERYSKMIDVRRERELSKNYSNDRVEKTGEKEARRVEQFHGALNELTIKLKEKTL